MRNFSNFRTRKWTSFRRNRRILAERALIQKVKNRAVSVSLVILLTLVVVSSLSNRNMMVLLASLFSSTQTTSHNRIPVALGAEGLDYSLCNVDSQCSRYKHSILPHSDSDYTQCYHTPTFETGYLCDSTQSPEVTIAIISGANKLERRNAIRRTWASVQSPSFHKVVFFVCVPIYYKDGGAERLSLAQESEQFGDLVLIEMTDTLFSGSRLVAFIYDFVSNCSALQHSKYLVKVNDDAFVNLSVLSRIVNYLSTSEGPKHFILGYPVELEPVVRVERQYRYVPESVFTAKTYPKYVQGEAYLVPIETVKRLFAVARCVRLLYIDDVMLNGLLLLYPIDTVVNSHLWFLSYRPDINVLHMYNSLAVAFGLTVADLDKLWQNLNSTQH